MAESQRDPDQDKDLLEEIRDNFAYASDYWQPVRDEAKEDMRYVAGDCWPEKEKKARKKKNRPCLNFDEINQYQNQVINDVRANPRAVKFTPQGMGANDQTAAFYANKMREIEYRSSAQIAYITALENAVQRGYGYVRLTTRYASDLSLDQDIWIEPVMNPDLVFPDPASVWPDLRDMRWLFNIEQRSRKSFQREFPKARIVDFSDYETNATYTRWITADQIQLAEYWKVLTTEKTLIVLRPSQPGGKPRGIYAEDIDKQTLARLTADQILGTRKVGVPSVVQYLTNGVEILEETPWLGKYIPFASCYGKVLYVDKGDGPRRELVSMTRPARDPQMLSNYYRTTEAELVGATPKFPYFAYKGQLDQPNLDKIVRSVSEPVPVIQIEPNPEGVAKDQILPHPQRQPYEPPIAALELGAEAARRAIQAAMGTMFLPTQAQRRNEKSGKALQQMEESAQKGSFHFLDHHNGMIERVGVMSGDLIPKVLVNAVETSVRKANGMAEMVALELDAERRLTDGEHVVTVSTGPSFDSEREAASDFADTLISSPLVQLLPPHLAGKMIAQAVKLKGVGQIGDEIAKLFDPSLDQEKQGDPQQLAAQAQQLLSENEQLKGLVAELKQAVETKAMELKAKYATTALQEQSETQRNREDNQTALAIAELQAAIKRLEQQFKDRNREDEQRHDMAMQAAESAQDERMARQAAAHESDMAERGNVHSLQQQAAKPQPEGRA